MSNRLLALTVIAGLSSMTGCATDPLVVSQERTAVIAAAVNDVARPPADKARDADRKPVAVVEFAGIHPGSKIAEALPGGGYFTRIFSKLVGADGVVYAWVPPRAANAPAGAPDFAAPMNALAADAQYKNIRVAAMDVNGTLLPERVDVVWTSLNYHDLHNRADANLLATNRLIFNTLKPGGVYIVIDHAAEVGSGNRDTRTLHRIDPEFVRKEVVAAGFEFVAASDALRNPADTHKLAVRDESLRGKTDQFVFKFRRPLQ
jgi:predicted methyltransferase